MNIVLDTDIFIDFLRGFKPSHLWFEQLDFSTVLFSAVTEAELLSGKDCEDESQMRKTLELLNLGIKVVVTNEIARKTGELRRKYGVKMLDAFIAATAILNNAKLITRNVKDFQVVKELVVEKPY